MRSRMTSALTLFYPPSSVCSISDLLFSKMLCHARQAQLSSGLPQFPLQWTEWTDQSCAAQIWSLVSSERSKLRRLGPTNWIINILDFKPSKIKRRFRSDSNNKIGSWLKHNIHLRLKSTNFWWKSMGFDLVWPF